MYSQLRILLDNIKQEDKKKSVDVVYNLNNGHAEYKLI